MNIPTFKDDLLELKDFSRRLERFIDIERDYVDGSLVVGLSSKFGSGKSTFLQMWMSSLENPETEKASSLVILLNAWESDYYGDPLFAIISGLIDGVKKEGKPADKLISAAKDFGWFAAAIGGQVAKKVSGIDAAAAGKLATTKKGEREDKAQLMPDAFSFYESRKNAMAALKAAIQELINEQESRVLFLVDELDRCRPDYAISYLETIKHIFDVKGAVFLLASDRKQLENSARTAFGAKLDFEEYYRKFVHREVTLPDISDGGYNKLASTYVNFYLEGEGARHCFMNLEAAQVVNITDFVGALKLTPRQLQEMFRILGHISETTEESKGLLLWGFAAGLIMMSALKIVEPEIYRLLGTQQLPPKQAYDFLSARLKENQFDWWFIICLTGGGLLNKESKTHEDIMRDVGLVNDDDDFRQSRDLGQYYLGWKGGYTSGFVQIHEKIEQLYQWR